MTASLSAADVARVGQISVAMETMFLPSAYYLGEQRRGLISLSIELRKIVGLPAIRDTESAMRAAIRDEFRGIAQYCPRQFSQINPTTLVQLVSLWREHTASIARGRRPTAAIRNITEAE